MRVERLSTAAVTLSAATLAVNLLWFRRPGGALPRPAPRLSVLVPARNEAHNLERCARSLLAQDYPDFELLMLDDHSTDATPAILARLVAEAQGDQGRRTLRTPSARALPPGWGGKNWACHQLADAADPQSRWLLFADADTWHAPDALRRAVAEAERDDLALLSLMPEQVMETWAERLVVSLLPLQILGSLPLPLAERLPLPSVAAANGQFLLFRRDAYERIGGHGAAPLGLAEDVTLARAVKRSRGRVRLGNGAGLVRCRMYRGVGEIVAGFRRSFAGGFRLGPGVSSLLLVWNFLAYALPFLRVRASRTARAQVVAVLLLRTLLAGRGQGSFRGLLGHPLGMALLLVAQCAAASDAATGRTSAWKGRVYGRHGWTGASDNATES